MPAPVLSYSGFVQLPVRLEFAICWGVSDADKARALMTKSLDQLEG
jgi:hypothetical protein